MNCVLVLTLLFAYALSLPHDIGNTNVGGRIHDGDDAKRGQFPYVVSIRDLETERHVCGAVIVTPKLLVSTGSCLILNSDRKLLAVAGLINVNDVGRDVQSVLVEYTTTILDSIIGSSRSSVAFIRLSSSFVFNDAVNAVKLPNPNTKLSGTAMFAGYGLTRMNPPSISSSLQYAELSIITNDECNEILANQSYSYPYLIFKDRLCGLPSGSGSGCHGDIGGPLVQNGTLVGIGYYVPTYCGEILSEEPNVFIRVSEYVSIIKSYAGLNSTSVDL